MRRGICKLNGWPSLVVVLAAAMAAGCSSTGLDGHTLSFTNTSEQTLYFQAWELEASYLVDPNPGITVSPGDGRILEPGESKTLGFDEVEGEFRPGRDLRVFLYAVTGTQAEFDTLLTFTAEELEGSDFRVEIGVS